MAAIRRPSRRKPHALARHVIVAAAIGAALVALEPSRFDVRLQAAVSLTAVTPYGASEGVTVQVTGTGFDPTVANNTVALTPPTGAAASVTPFSIATLDASKGLRRLGIRVPAGLAMGPATVRVTNLTTGESASGSTLQIIAIGLPDTRSAARGAQNVVVRVSGSSNVQFVAGRTTPMFGAGVTVTATQVTSPTSLLATVSVSSSTPLGTRSVTVVTSTQTAQLPGAFTIVDSTGTPPPTANAGADQTVAVGSVVTLNGGASSNPNGNPLTFAWSFVSIPAGNAPALSDPAAVGPTFLADRPGTYELRLIVSDGAVASAPDTVRISTQNSRPVANAGSDQTGTIASTVRLDGSASSDPDGDPLTFSWSFVSSPPGSTAALSNASAVDPTFVLDRFGDYVIQLVVSDGPLSSLVDSVTISTLNSAPVARAGADETALVGDTITLNGSGSSDADGHSLTFRWSFTNNPPGSAATLSDAAALNPSFVIDVSGVYVLQLIVNDGTVDSAPDTVTVTTLNSPPVANAGPDQVASVGDSVQLNGAGSTDVDGNSLTFSWSLTTRPAGSTATLSDPTAVNPTLGVDRFGTYIAQLTVHDGTVDSAPDTVNIGSQNQSPIANAGVNQTVALGAMVQLDGSASTDPNGDPLTFSWSLVSRPDGSTAQLSDTAVQAPTFVADRPGSYVAQLVVNDGTANSAPHSVTISTLNSVPIANAGLDRSVATGSTVQLDASASLDPDGTPLLFAWSLLSRPAGSGATPSDPAIGNPTFVADTAGVYVAQLIVGDGTLVSAPDTVTITVADAADLRIEFFAASTTLTPAVGTIADFMVVLTNDGPASADEVTARVLLPAGYTFSSAGPVFGTYDSATGIWTIGSRTRNQFASLGLRAVVNPTGPYDVTATITGSSQPDPNLSNNTVTAIVTPNASADLRVEFFAPSTTLNAPVGTIADFMVVLTNDGPASAAEVTARVLLPAGYTFSSAGPVFGTYDSATGIWTIGSRTRGQFASLGLRAVVNPTGPYDVTATITGSSQPDANLANNTVTAVVTANPNADLRIAFSNPPAGNVTFGQVVDVRVDVNSSGPATTTGVVVHFPVPDGYTFNSVVAGGNVYNSATGDWTIGSVSSGAGVRATLILGLRVNPTGPMNLTATIASSSQPDPNLANNTATAAPPNRPPVASAGGDLSVNTHADVALDGSGSLDPDGDGLTFRWVFSVRPGSSAAAVSNADASIASFIPDRGGRYDVQLVVTDSHGVASAVDTVTVLATVVNLAPAITSPAVTTGAVSQLYRYDAAAFDPDAGDTLTFSLTTAPAGMAIDAATGVIAWTPSDTQAGPQAVILRVQDQGGLVSTQSFAIQVSSDANHAPAAADDASEVRVGESVSVNAPGVLANDVDADGHPLTVALLTPPSNGSVILNSDGSFTYTPHTLQASDFVLLENLNLATRVPGVVVSVSSTWFPTVGAFAADDDLGSSWRASGFDTVRFVEVSFPYDVSVTELQVFGHREPFLVAGGIRNTTGFFQLFAADGTELFRSGGIDLPAPNADARHTVGTISGVRRARFTITAFNAEAGLAEFKVIGSALIRRPLTLERNLAQLLPTVARASSANSANPTESAIDDVPQSNWYAESHATGEFFELAFPVDVNVTELQTANPSGRPDGFGTSLGIDCSGNFALLDATGAVLFDSGVVNEPSGGISASDTFTLAVPNVGGVRRVRWTSAGCTSVFQPGFSEFKVIGTAPITAPAFSVAKKFQALVGREVHSTPIVANLTDDNHDGRIDANDIPDIIVPVESLTSQITGEIKVVSGDDGRDLFTAGGPNLVSPWSEVAVGDLDGDGVPEIVAIHTDGNHLTAFEHTGEIRWMSDVNPMPRFVLQEETIITGAIAIANLDGGPRPHIIVGASVFDAGGRLLGDGRTLGGTTGGIGLRSAMPAVANLDLDGVPEIIAGPTAYRLVNGQLTVVWRRADRPDGYAAIGNVDNDPFPEIVIAGNGFVYMLNHDGTDAEVWNPPTHAPLPIPGGGLSDTGGAPTLADLDGDGIPEIGIASSVNYFVFNRDGVVRWQSAIEDRSSRSTGSTVFDLDGDGSVEVIYRDEVYLRIYRGADGVLLAKIPMGSGTWSELPVVADVDNDGHADIVVSSDIRLRNSVADTGVYVLEDVADKWARTRRIWNQHSYHVTNVNEDGTIPRVERPHWLVPGLNSFRLNAFIGGENSDERDSFTYKATDGTLESNVATVRIAVRPANSPPQFTSTPVTNGATTVRYSYVAHASDPDAGDVFVFSLPTAPAGMTIDPDFGFVEWTPSGTQLGPHDVVIRVQDARGEFALQPYSVQVSNPVTVPDVVGQAQGSAEIAIGASGFAVGAVSTLTHPVVPTGSVISQNPLGGALAAPGSPVSLAVSLGRAVGDTDNDGDGVTPNQGDCNDTTANVHPGAADIPGNGVDENCDGADAVDPATLDGDGDGFTPAAGDCNDTNPAINPNAIDVPGNGIDENCSGADATAGDTTLPTAILLSPADGAVITMPADIVGIATDDNFLRYRLEFGSVDAAFGTVLAAGTAPVTGVLGRVDPTLLENGLYRVRLIVEDVNGQVAVDERVYRITGEAKVGLFALSFIDLQVPVSGIPITLIRSYDSRVKARQDFGIGWSLQIKNGKYQNNRPPGQGWIINDQPFLGTFLPCIGGSSETRSHLTEVRLSEREWYTFALALTSGNLGITGACEATASFRFIDGTTPGATLEILDGTSVIYLRGGADDVLDMNAFLDGTSRVYNPQHVRLTTIDGRKIDLDRTAGITRIEDLNGNALSITAGGITHSSGKSVSFVRDTLGRISLITDPSGKRLTYGYNANGDLAEFVDQAGNRTTFSYDARHNLVEIHDPLGNRAVRSEFDSGGRLTAVIDAQGNRTEFTHNLSGRQEVIRDRLGRVSVHDYDPSGNVVATTDVFGRQRQFTYDDRGNQLTETDPLGRTSSTTYDVAGNPLTHTDFDGNTATYTFNARRQLLTTVDATGRTTTHVYDSRGNLTRKVDAEGNVTQYTLDRAGNAVVEVDPLGNTTRHVYDSAGNQTTVTDALGNAASLAYDSIGNLLVTTQARTLPNGSTQPIIRRFEYDAANQLARMTNTVGGVTRLSYDPLGHVRLETDPVGTTTRSTYDELGRLVRADFADGSRETFTFDGENRQTSRTDRDGHTTRFERSLVPTSHGAIERLTTVHPDGATTVFDPDVVGRPAQRIDARGNVTAYSYGPNIKRVTDALGNTTVQRLDGAGRPIEIVDALGRSISFAYDANGQLIRATHADGSFTTIGYDAAGRKTSETNQAGQTTRFAYDAIGRLTTVTDPSGGVTTYGYDEAGNMVRQTDASGRITRMEHDAARRITRRTRPLGQSEAFAYDAAGSLNSHTDFNSRVGTMTYDSDARLIRKELNGLSLSYTFTPGGRRTGAGSDSYGYDAQGRLLDDRKSTGETISYTYDASGNRLSMTTPYGTTAYSYDLLNRLETVTDATGNTTYTYDAVGNLASVSYPNQVVTTYIYDDLNRLVQMVTSGPVGLIASYSYTLDPNGRRTSVVETGPATTNRVVDYTYDAVNRLISEVIHEAGAADQRISYTYDAVGNRLSKTVVAAGTTTTSYAYDDNDRLLAETTIVTFASHSPAEGLRYALLGFPFSPLVVGIFMVGLWGTRQQTMPCRPARRLIVKSLVVSLLIAAQLLVPVSEYLGRESWLGATVAEAQSADMVTYTYDDNGNTLSRSIGNTTDGYTYDAENRLIAATVRIGTTSSVTYTYDADGIRTSKTADGVTTTFLVDKNRDFAQVVAEVTGDQVVTYSYGHDRISQTRPAVGQRFYQYDGQHSTRQLTDSTGTVSDTYDYDAFGVLLTRTGATPNLYLYTGEQLDPNLGFYYLRARYYAAASGRFLTTDPLQGSIFDPVSLHRYLYANADPINGRDPSGAETMLTLTVGVAIGGILAAISYASVGNYPAAAIALLVAATAATRGRTLYVTARAEKLAAAAAPKPLPGAGRETYLKMFKNLATSEKTAWKPVEVEVETIISELGKKGPRLLVPPLLFDRQSRAQNLVNEIVTEYPVAGPIGIELFILSLEMVGEIPQPPGVAAAVDEMTDLLRGALP